MKKLAILAILLTLSGGVGAQNYDQWIDRSFDLLEADSTAAAAEALRAAMRLEPANPRNSLLLTNLGTLQRELGQAAEAEISYSAALGLAPDNDKALASRAALRAERNDLTGAIDDYTALLTLRPHDEDALYRRALCRLMTSDTLGARLDLEAIDAFNPLSAKARMGMAYVYKAEGLYADAAELYTALMASNPRNARLLRERAEVYYMGGRLGAALSDINESIALRPTDPLGYVLRARFRYARGDREYARRDLQKAREMGIDDAILVDLEQNLEEKHK